MKKIMAVILTLVMALGLVGTASAEYPYTYDVVEDLGGITLKVWMPLWWTSKITSYDQNEVFNALEQKFNVDFVFETPVAGSEQEQFNLMMTNETLPDIIFTNWSGIDLYTGGLDKYVEEGAIINLLDYKEYMPNYLYCIENEVLPEERLAFYTDSGYMTQFAAISPYEEYACHGLLFRQDWMQELNFELPQTLDDVEKILTAFKNEKGAEAPLIFPEDGIDSAGILLSAYGVGPGIYNDNGTVKYGPYEKAFKDYLIKMNDWYEKGLIDIDFVSRDEEGERRLLTTGGAGSIMHSPDTTIVYMKGISEMIGGTYPTLTAGERVHYREKMYQFRPPYCAAISTSCKYIKEAMTILDYGYTYDGWMLCNYGQEGITYNMEGDVAVFTDVLLNNPEYPSLMDSFAKYKWHIGPFLRFEHESDAAITVENMGTRRALTENADSDFVMPLVSMTADEGSEYASIMNQLQTYQDAAVVNFICGRVDIEENFDSYIADLKKLNVERAIEIQQAALARYLAR